MKRSILRICMHMAVLFSVGRAEPSSFEHVPQPQHETKLPAASSVKPHQDDSTIDTNPNEESLRRKRRNEQRQQQQQQHRNWMWEGMSEGGGAAQAALVTAAESTLDTVADSLEELWDRESARAASEVERLLLQGGGTAIGSMPQAEPTGAPAAMVPVTMMPIAPITQSPSTTTTATPTSIPDRGCLMGRSPEQYLLDEMLMVTNVNLLLDPNTPQGMAFNFMLEDPTVRRDLCGYPTMAQRYGLGTYVPVI